MRILTRYVLFDLLKVFLLTLTGLTLLIFVVLIGKEAVDKGIGLGPLLRMAPYLLPQAMQFAVPGTMLLATTYVYGRMASYNEIVAIKSLGISPMALIWPTFVLATLVSFGAVVLNDIAVSWGRLGVQRVFLASIEEVTYGQLRMQHTYNLGKANIIGARCRRPSTDSADADHSSVGRPAGADRFRRGGRAAACCRKKARSSLRLHDFEHRRAVQVQGSGHVHVRSVARGADRLDDEEPQPVELRAGGNRAGDRRAGRSGRAHRAEHASRRPRSAC